MNNELSTGCFKVSILIYLLFFNALYFLLWNVEIMNQKMYFCITLLIIYF